MLRFVSKLFNISVENNGWLTLSLLIGFIGVLSYIFNQNRNKKPVKIWTQVGRVKKLTVFPLKSCLGLELTEAVATPVGLKSLNAKFVRDRVFMVMGAGDTYQDSEKALKMASISFEALPDNQSIVLRSPYTDPITIKVPEDTPEARRKCSFHTEKIQEVLDCGDEVATWLVDFLEKPELRLYYHYLERTQRTSQSPVQRRFDVPPSAKGTLQHDTSYMLMSQESMDELNRHLVTPVTHDSFRPSILIEGTPAAFAEDFWDIVRIGNVDDGLTLKNYLPCSRCGQININQPVGVKSDDGEPLKTLFKLQRQVSNNPKFNKYGKGKAIMGIHLGCIKSFESEGRQRDDPIIRVGDPVYALI